MTFLGAPIVSMIDADGEKGDGRWTGDDVDGLTAVAGGERGFDWSIDDAMMPLADEGHDEGKDDEDEEQQRMVKERLA